MGEPGTQCELAVECGEVLRRDRPPTVIADPRSEGDGFTALGYGVHRALYPAAAASVTVSMGDDFERRANAMTGFRKQRLVEKLIVAEKP
jgi:hypothetical protein